jgi:tungstate transport system ATP-binding protein
LIGPNGAGKTTLLHVAALLRRPDAGTVTILGQRATAENAATLRRTLSVVFQDPLLFDVPVLANAAAGLRFQGYARKEAEARARSWLERFGVGRLAGRKARSLSGGEGSRVALARAFATEPALLLLDEPFSALDAPTRAALLPMLRERLRETDTAAVLVTHDLDEAFALGDRVAVMNAGKVVASGDAPGLVAHPPSMEVAALLGVETILPAIVRRVDDEYACVELRPAGPALRSRLRSGTSVSPGQFVTLTLPAGAATVLPPGAVGDDDWTQLPGTVREVTLLPTGTRLVVETPAPIVALPPWDASARRWSVGDRACVTLAPEAAHLISDDV